MFTVWLPTAYSANVSAEQSVDGHISASPGIWLMADCYNVLWSLPLVYYIWFDSTPHNNTCTYMHSMVPAYYTHSPNPPRKIETTSVTVRDNDNLTSESLKDLMCLGTTWYQLESCRGHGSCLTLYYDFKTC